ncbi:unnamed protein product [Clonostachys rosea f. rosea IK726]|jgi:hypothetical protein|uniref:Uncharacterized protein n=1 Tax=Clonostachys rosea f. rosea IK726 TaxID=1349383 RepID=A0ACA9UMU7_BIOOC|nr:unnamed protein product [Clonostachys rosea f. rosea IK726]
MEVDVPRDFLMDTDDQVQSPLFRLPLEVRRTIYELAFKEQPIDDGNYVKGISDENFIVDECQDQQDSAHSTLKIDGTLPNWLRPGCTTRLKTETALLRTCQLVYIEASSLLVSTMVLRCYQGYGPTVGSYRYLKRLTVAQRSNVHRLHLFSQVRDFDRDGPLLRQKLEPVAKSLQHLTITLRDLGDSPETPMLLNPYQTGVAKSQAMSQYMEKTKRGEELNIPPASWASSFAFFPALKTLTMELEDQEGRESELESFAQWATTWKFPLWGNQFMSSKTAPSSRAWQRPRPQYNDELYGSYKPPPRIITWIIRWDAPPTRTVANDVASQEEIMPTTTETDDEPLFQRPAYDPRLGGLNSIFAHASESTLRELAEWGVI